MIAELQAWVEARKALQTGRVMSYQVWQSIDGIRTRLASFSVNRGGGWQVALYLANTMRDDINQRIA